MDKEVDTTGAMIPSKHQAPPSVITTRVNCVHSSSSSHSYYLVEQKRVSDPPHINSDETLIYDT